MAATATARVQAPATARERAQIQAHAQAPARARERAREGEWAGEGGPLGWIWESKSVGQGANGSGGFVRVPSDPVGRDL